MPEEMYYSIKETEEKIHLGESFLPLGRYQIVAFCESIDENCFAPLPCRTMSIMDSKYLSENSGEKTVVFPNGITHIISETEMKMKVFCFESIQFEGSMPDFGRILDATGGFYFRYNKYYSPDIYYLTEVLKEDMPEIGPDDLYTCIYSNKFDYVYKISGTRGNNERNGGA